MSKSGQDRAGSETSRLREALEAETARCNGLRRQLDRSTAEFEEFISVAAHDLRQSLRDVALFSQLLAETYATGRLDSDAAGYLERIQSGSDKMQSLLTDIVDYWAVGAGALQPSPTNMEAVLSQALLRAANQITERSASVSHDPLPLVSGDFETLTRLLHHLIRNAIQYCPKHPPQVHISATREPLEWVLTVRDNGPGVEPAFQKRIFEPFQRLQGKECPGSGLGLAFCKKAIERQGGRIWMESEPGQGSTIHFSLPPAD